MSLNLSKQLEIEKFVRVWFSARPGERYELIQKQAEVMRAQIKILPTLKLANPATAQADLNCHVISLLTATVASEVREALIEFNKCLQSFLKLEHNS